jgi:polysaccharide biosynthesis PFTS motif protein
VANTAARGIPVEWQSGAVPALSGTKAFRYAAWIVAATIVTAVELCRGRWWHAFLFAEAALAAEARLQAPERIATDYLFHNGGWIYRPLWTYEAERHGARILFYFYSTNCETFKQPWGYPPQANHWNQVTWPHFLVWDEPQAAFVRRAIGTRGHIEVVGPIWFSSSSSEPTARRPAVAVFDVQPWRDSAYQMLGLADEYYTPHTVVQFLVDVHAAARAAGATMLLKRKRDAGPVLHPRYVHQVERLAREPDCQCVDPSLAASRVIECCDVVVSAPFTSTALLGRHQGRPSVYYDPWGAVQLDDRAAHGIPIVVGRTALTTWMIDRLAGGVQGDD